VGSGPVVSQSLEWNATRHGDNVNTMLSVSCSSRPVVRRFCSHGRGSSVVFCPPPEVTVTAGVVWCVSPALDWPVYIHATLACKSHLAFDKIESIRGLQRAKPRHIRSSMHCPNRTAISRTKPCREHHVVIAPVCPRHLPAVVWGGGWAQWNGGDGVFVSFASASPVHSASAGGFEGGRGL
jgi:hypothetical protein